MMTLVWSAFNVVWVLLRYVLSVILPGFDTLPKELSLSKVKNPAENPPFNEDDNSEIQVARNSDFFQLVVPEWLFDKNAKMGPADKVSREDSQHRHYWSCERKHSWSWKADERLSEFWRSLRPEDQNDIRVVREEELLREIEKATCVISKENRVALAKLYVVDVHFLQVFGDIFWKAVETNTRVVVSRYLMECIRKNVDKILEKKGSKLSSFQIAAKEHCRLLFVTKFLKVLERNVIRAFRSRDSRLPVQAYTGSQHDGSAASGASVTAAADLEATICSCTCHRAFGVEDADGNSSSGSTEAREDTTESATKRLSSSAACTNCKCSPGAAAGADKPDGNSSESDDSQRGSLAPEELARRMKRKEKRERKKQLAKKLAEDRRMAKENERERRKEQAREARVRQEEQLAEQQRTKTLKTLLGKLESKLSDAHAIYGKKDFSKKATGVSSLGALTMKSTAFEGPSLLDLVMDGDSSEGEFEEDPDLAALRLQRNKKRGF